jgi:ABC-type Na+ efflux pump permease subunit
VFLGHIAVGLAGKRAAPSVSLGTWVMAVQLVDLLWPLFLLAGLEHVRIAPGITAFTPLDFYDYPITHSLIGAAAWAALFAGIWIAQRRQRAASRTLTPRSEAPRASRVGVLLAAGVLSHWILDVVSHRPDMPVLPHGPYLGLGLWNSIPETLVVELTLFAAGIVVYLRTRPDVGRRVSFWLLIGFLVLSYLGSVLGPPPPSVRILAVAGLSMWLLIPWVGFVDRAQSLVDSL